MRDSLASAVIAFQSLLLVCQNIAIACERPFTGQLATGDNNMEANGVQRGHEQDFDNARSRHAIISVRKVRYFCLLL